jgi:hypothetical protein
VRTDLIQSIADYRRSRRLALVSDFERHGFDATDGFHRIGGGSLGGKARGLAFVRKLLSEAELEERFRRARARAAGEGDRHGLFDEFLQQNDLHHFAIQCEDPAASRRMLAAPLPDAGGGLESARGRIQEPLAVRSSSLLEDSQFQSFSGVYETYMLPNCHPDPRYACSSSCARSRASTRRPSVRARARTSARRRIGWRRRRWRS